MKKPLKNDDGRLEIGGFVPRSTFRAPRFSWLLPEYLRERFPVQLPRFSFSFGKIFTFLFGLWTLGLGPGTSRAATVTNTLWHSGGPVEPNATVTFSPLSTLLVLSNGHMVVSRPFSLKSDSNGAFSTNVLTGGYRVTIGNSPPNTVQISVPNDENTYSLTQLITNTVNGVTGQTGSPFERTINKGATNGYAPLDGSAKVPTTNLPPTTAAGTNILALTNGSVVTISSPVSRAYVTNVAEYFATNNTLIASNALRATIDSISGATNGITAAQGTNIARYFATNETAGASNGLVALHGPQIAGNSNDIAGIVARAVTNVISLSTSNGTSKPLTQAFSDHVLTFYGLEAGANTTLTPNGSNIVIASTGGGGAGISNVISLSTSNATSKPLTQAVSAGVITLFGLEQGANITLTPNGSNVVIAATSGGDAATKVAIDTGLANVIDSTNNITGSNIVSRKVVIATNGFQHPFVALPDTALNFGSNHITQTITTNTVYSFANVVNGKFLRAVVQVQNSSTFTLPATVRCGGTNTFGGTNGCWVIDAFYDGIETNAFVAFRDFRPAAGTLLVGDGNDLIPLAPGAGVLTQSTAGISGWLPISSISGSTNNPAQAIGSLTLTNNTRAQIQDLWPSSANTNHFVNYATNQYRVTATNNVHLLDTNRVSGFAQASEIEIWPGASDRIVSFDPNFNLLQSNYVNLPAATKMTVAFKSSGASPTNTTAIYAFGSSTILATIADLNVSSNALFALSTNISLAATQYVIRAEDPPFNARPGVDNTAAIQAALNALTGRKGKVTITYPGRYYVKRSGANPFHGTRGYALIMTNNNVTFELGHGVWLGLTNNAVTNTPCDVITLGPATNIIFSGSGTISGNASAQATATFSYSQVDHGLGISGNNIENVLVSGLTINDCFSNPVNMQDGRSVFYAYLNTYDCGEGPQMVSITNVWMDHVTFTDTNNVSVGDALELARCDFGFVNNCRTYGTNTPVGSCLDLYASTRISVSGCYFKWNYGIGLQDTFEGNDKIQDQVLIVNTTVEMPPVYTATVNAGVNMSGRSGRYLISNCQFLGGLIGVQTTTNFSGIAGFEGCNFFNINSGFYIDGAGTFNINGGLIMGTGEWGVQVYSANNAGVSSNGPTLNINGLTLASNVGAINIDGQSTNNYTLRGSWVDLHLVGNGNGNTNKLTGVANDFRTNRFEGKMVFKDLAGTGTNLVIDAAGHVTRGVLAAPAYAGFTNGTFDFHDLVNNVLSFAGPAATRKIYVGNGGHNYDIVGLGVGTNTATLEFFAPGASTDGGFVFKFLDGNSNVDRTVKLDRQGALRFSGANTGTKIYVLDFNGTGANDMTIGVSSDFEFMQFTNRAGTGGFQFWAPLYASSLTTGVFTATSANITGTATAAVLQATSGNISGTLTSAVFNATVGNFTNGTANVGTTNINAGLHNLNLATNWIASQTNLITSLIPTNDALSNIVINFDQPRREIFHTNNLTFTNHSGLVAGTAKDVRIHLWPQLINRTLTWPTLGAASFSTRWYTNQNSPMWTTATQGIGYTISLSSIGTNVEASITEWK